MAKANSIGALIEGLTILGQLMPQGFDTTQSVVSEHEKLFIYVDEELTPGSEDSEGHRLRSLGFSYDSADGCWSFRT
jgi:hypothetical protein